jgi:glycosyltransferase EpsF
MFEYRVSQFLRKDQIYFDYLVTEQAGEEELERYRQEGSNVYRLPIDHKHGLLIRELKINRAYYNFFKAHHYDIVYADTENALRAIHLFMARLAGIPVRVVHSHNTGLQTESKSARKISRIIRTFFSFSATHYFACSDMAAEWLFPKKVYQNRQYKRLANGVDLNEFAYNGETRAEIRKRLEIKKDAVVVGNVGRFMPQKNHEFMLKVFKEILLQRPDAKLMLIGSGPLEQRIKQLAVEMDLNDSVIFVGTTPKVVDYYQAMDVFFLPSLFEGLPITGIEAQAAGLPCVFSDAITSELAITKLAHYCSLDEDPKAWCSMILNCAEEGRQEVSEEIRQAGYSIEDTVNSLRTFYKKNQF